MYNFIFDMDPQVDFAMPNPWSIPLEVQPPPEASKQEAICYFLRGNAIPGSLWMGDFVTRFLAEPGAKPSQKAMQSSIIAVSSAMLCRVRKMTSLKDLAQKEYVSALNLLNTALADVEEAKTNQALGAVVLLAVYEVSLPFPSCGPLHFEGLETGLQDLTRVYLGCHIAGPSGY
jgi:hypothetical protein